MKRKNLIILSVILLLIILSSIMDTDDNVNYFNVGVVSIEGPITESKKIIENLNNFNKSDNIDAIMLKINSPGGAVVPSQEIYKKVDSISNESDKPIVASIGSLGASGGYYIAIGADKIVANSGSLVGSIGVIMNFPIVKDMFDRIGLRFETVKSGKYKDSGSPYRESNDADTKYFKEITLNLHDQFVNEVALQRGITTSKTRLLAKGQIYTGAMAYENNLIDTIGTFEEALNIMQKMTNITNEIRLIYPKEDESLFSSIFESFNSLKVILREFHNMPLYIMGGMYD